MRKKEDIEKFKEKNFITCECGYNNFKYNIEFYGTCIRCNKILNKKSKFRYDMCKKLNLWRKK